MKVTQQQGKTVGAHQASELAKRVADGEPYTAVVADYPKDIKAAVRRIIEDGDMDMKGQRRLRRSQITRLITHDDPDVAAKGVALSQKEEPQATTATAQVNFFGAHWAHPPPDGRQLEAEDDAE
jgi:hypothetical protein